MAKLNLLPWREELKKERENRFAVILMFCLLCTGAVVFSAHLYMENWIAFQNSRNDYLKAEIERAKKANEEIKTLEAERERLYARMRVIHTLQSNRSEIVHLFDEIALRLPDGIYFTSLIQKDRQISIEGMAQSNAFITRLMRQFADSKWLSKPTLGLITVVQEGEKGRKYSKFKITFNQLTPETDKKADDGH